MRIAALFTISEVPGFTVGWVERIEGSETKAFQMTRDGANLEAGME